MSGTPHLCSNYLHMLILLQRMTPEQLKCNITIYDPDTDEYYPCKTLLTASDTNCVLDKDHPYLSP